MAPNDGESLKDDNGNVTTSSETESGSGSHSVCMTTTSEEAENHSRLDDLADQAAKKVDEFSALLADVESRNRNQRVLLERHFDNMELGDGKKRPTTLALLTTVNHKNLPEPASPLSKLKVDEVLDFGPLSKKLKKNADLSPISGTTTEGYPSGRRFSSSLAASLPRCQYGRKNSVPPGLLNSTLALASGSTPAASESASSSKVNEDQNTVGGLVKLFSETSSGGQGSTTSERSADKKKFVPPPLRPPPCNSPPSSARLLVRGPDQKVVFCSEPRSPLANGPPLSPRVTSPLPHASHPAKPYLSAGDIDVNGRRSPSPNFSNSFFFGKNMQAKMAESKSDRPISPLVNVEGGTFSKRTSSPSTFPNPFAFARKFSGAFVLDNGKEKVLKGDRPLSPGSLETVQIPSTPRNGGQASSTNSYSALKKTNDFEKDQETMPQGKSSVNVSSPYPSHRKYSQTNGSSPASPANPKGSMCRSMSHLTIAESWKKDQPNEPRSKSPNLTSVLGSTNRRFSPKKDKASEVATPPSDQVPRQRADISNLERLLAGLNFSKFRITDRLMAIGSMSPLQSSQQAGFGADPLPQLGQQRSSPSQEASPLSPARSSMTRTLSQPSGLSTASPLLETGKENGVQLRRDRPRVTLSEDRFNLSSSAHQQPTALLYAGASSEKVSEDIASLITDIRQHFQLSRKRELPPLSTPSSSLDTTKHEGGADTAGLENNRDSDYVASVVSDCDCSEIAGGLDENCEVDTESTSSSFIFSPTASSASRATTVDRMESLIPGVIHSVVPAAVGADQTDAHQHKHPQTNSPLTLLQQKKANETVLYAAVVCATSPYSRTSSAERSMTFPPGQGRKNSLADSAAEIKYLQAPNSTWEMDDPENRLSSASFPESAVSLTDSVYSTAGSTSLSSYIDTSLSDSSTAFVRPTLLHPSECNGEAPKDLRLGKPRYHSDPMTVAVTSQMAPLTTSVSSHTETAQPILLPNSTKSLPAPAKKSAALHIPHILKDVVMRESGGHHLGLSEENRSNGVTTIKPPEGSTSAQKSSDYRSDSFRRSEKRLPRGPFGARLEEDQLRREQRQLIQDLSFLHDSPASTPGLPENPSSLIEDAEKMPKRRQSAALPQQQERLPRQYTAVKSSPDLFRTASHHGGTPSSGGLRVGDICRSVSDAQASSWKKITEETDSAIYSGSSDSVPTEASSSGSQLSTKVVTDFRTHIVREIYDTENSYVDSLQILERYYSTLRKNEDLVEKTLSENMFFQIPSIKQHHESLLMRLKHRMEHWDNRQKIGDLIVDTFTKEAVIDTYTAFINNWKTAKDAIKLAKTTRPCFVRCLEEWTREHRGKLNLDALLIMPVQRIPRYELLIKELLKHTAEDHPDRADLESAQNQLHDLALKINAMEHEVDEAERMMIRLKELEMYIDGLTDLVEPNRKFLKFDMVTMSSGMGMKKDRCLFLFSDLLVITNLKRKSGTMRKPSTQSCSPQLYPTLESNKYKLLMRVCLEDLELAKPALMGSKKAFSERELLECDLGVLSKISDLTTNLSASHQPLDEAVRSMMAQVSRQLAERQSHANDPSLSKVELTVATQNGLETVSVNFLSPVKRNTWERAFLEAKQTLSLSADRKPPPDFLNPIPIRKTRAGLQLTCVATTTDLNVHDLKDVWVCNSDGYVGQVCVLSMQPEPALTSCVAVSNCKITCIASVPSTTTIHKGGALLHSGNVSPISDHSSSGDTSNDPCIAMELNSDDSSDEDNSLDEHSRSCPSDKEPFPMSLSEDEMAAKAHYVPDPTQGTMWIGMEDGRIFVYYCNDNIRIRKPRIKIQFPSAVHCITTTEHTVLVGLGNGQVAAFHRPAQGFWETLHPTYIDLGPSAAAVQQMIVVCGRLWCACQNVIHVINLSALQIETSFPVVADANRHVTEMVSSGLGVWVSVQNSVVLRLCNALTYEFVADLNLTPSVQKMLAGCDEILRQHKFACLRVTALLTCKDLLWVGTSAGVIMTISIPHIIQGMTKLSSMPTVTGIWHGHTGQVRFLHCLEQSPGSSVPIPSSTRRSIRRERRHSIAIPAMNKMIVISGGDGYEDFRCTTSHATNGVTDNSGRDDSTNHLLLWQC